MKALVLIVALLVPGVAWADGWVLWFQSHDFTKPASTYETWEMSRAFETFAACEMEAKESVQRLGTIPVLPGQTQVVQDLVRPVEIIISGPDGKVARGAKLWCLPGATDPRPRCEK